MGLLTEAMNYILAAPMQMPISPTLTLSALLDIYGSEPIRGVSDWSVTTSGVLHAHHYGGESVAGCCLFPGQRD